MKKELPELGLCCLFKEEPIKFRTYTFKKISSMENSEAREKILTVWDNNIESLQKAFNYCKENNISSYRIGSDIFPQYDRVLYLLSKNDIDIYQKKLQELNTHDLVLSMHPGQHVNMGSPKPDVIQNSIIDLKYHYMFAKNLDIKEINIHLGGAYGDKESAKKRFIQNMSELQRDLLDRITIENDELNYDVHDCIEVAKALGIRVTYDIHHERCYALKRGYSYLEHELAQKSSFNWNGHQRLHISTPRYGYSTPSKSRSHSDYINPSSIPQWVFSKCYHIDVEAKYKEKAIFKLRSKLMKGNK